MDDKRTLYEILKVSKTATRDEIKHQYRALMHKHHTDRYERMRASAKGDPELAEIVEEKIKAEEDETKKINEAYDVLYDPDKRKAYDKTLRTAPGTSGPSAPPPPRSPDIRISKTRLDFGSIMKGEKRSDSFLIENVGGPVETYGIGWKGSPDWAEASVQTTPVTIFPILVTVNIMGTALKGTYRDEIGVVIDGTVFNSVTVTATVVVPAPQPTPTHTPPPTPPPSYAHPTPPAPTTPTSTSKTPWLTIGVVGIILLLCWVGISGISSVQNAQVTQTAVAMTVIQAEKQKASADIKTVLTVNRTGSVDCKELAGPYYHPDNCDHTWGNYQLKNNTQYLTISIGNASGTTCLSQPNGYNLDVTLYPGQSANSFCQETTKEKPTAVCWDIQANTEYQYGVWNIFSSSAICWDIKDMHFY